MICELHIGQCCPACKKPIRELSPDQGIPWFPEEKPLVEVKCANCGVLVPLLVKLLDSD